MKCHHAPAAVELLERRRLLAAVATNEQMVAVDFANGFLALLNVSGDKTSIDTMVDNSNHPSFSPDRTRILFDGNGNNVEATYEIYTINVDGTGLKRLTVNTVKDFHPHFSPDGSKIVFVSKRDGNDEIYVMDADGSHQTRLTNNSADDNDPRFSPDGTRIIFDSDSSGKPQIYTIDAATGGDLKRLTNDNNYDTDPVYSPDGGRIAYALGGNIWVIDARGSGPGTFPPRQITNTDNMPVTGDSEPEFSPDGTTIAFHRNKSEGGNYIYIAGADDGSFEMLVSDDGFASPGWASVARFSALSFSGVTVNGTAGADHISLGFDDDNFDLTFTVNGKTETYFSARVQQVLVFCGGGNDTFDATDSGVPIYVSGDAGDDKLIGGRNDDTLTGGSGRNTLYGGDGDDRLNGSGGRDFLYGDGGNDRMYGNAGNDYMVGGSGVDRMWGGAGDDLLSGNSGNDKIFGEDGNDQLLGGDGNDLVYGGLGIDTCNGGKGTDGTDFDTADDIWISIEVIPPPT